MNYLEAIVQIDNVVSNDFCKEIINSYDSFKLENLSVLKEIDKNERNVLGYSLGPNKDPFDKIKKEIERLYIYYEIKFPFIVSNKINQIDLLKY